MRMILAAAVLASCASTGGFGQLRAEERDRFDRCYQQTAPTFCPGSTDEMVVANCMNGKRAEYAQQRDDEARRRMLMANGCPASMVRPEAY